MSGDKQAVYRGVQRVDAPLEPSERSQLDKLEQQVCTLAARIFQVYEFQLRMMRVFEMLPADIPQPAIYDIVKDVVVKEKEELAAILKQRYEDTKVCKVPTQVRVMARAEAKSARKIAEEVARTPPKKVFWDQFITIAFDHEAMLRNLVKYLNNSCDIQSKVAKAITTSATWPSSCSVQDLWFRYRALNNQQRNDRRSAP
jgi:hypothetical protein